MKNYFLWLAVAVLAGVSSVRAQEVVNTNHTVVRFEIFTGGQPFGSLDIELFDQEKPETVRNFLNYVYRGAYSNLVIHRLVTNFVLQGGNVIVTNPADTGAFSTYTEGANYGQITNEYSVGPELSNGFGTIAMARVGVFTNSASGNWFFNLADNSFLDTVAGGYTVFGRVVNTTTAPRTGTNLLNYFNTVPWASAFIPYTYLTNLPVSGTPLTSPRYADLFTVNAKIISGPQLPAPQHSVVRFHVNTGGTNFGLLDIELFDQEKPETVKNFLLYVYSGVYSNLVIDRLDPNFVMQAGRMKLANPTNPSAFTIYTSSVNWQRITNEYGVGPELSNDFGTLSMARVPGDTNSASSEFFFNLTNNPHLNTNDGGFTVFGRVINSYDAQSGTNLLNYFNTFVRGLDVTSVFIFDYFEFLQEVPVSARRAQVLLPDLFTIQSAVIQGVTVRDAIPPITTVTAPTNAITTTNATFHFTGTGADNQALHRVFVDGPQGRIVADGRTNWSADVPLHPGTNDVLVFGIDAFGNQSVVERRKIFYSVKVPVTLQYEGLGQTAGITNGQMLEVGVTYQLTATPARGYYFVNWRGSVLDSRLRAVNFTMESNAVVLCRFSRNLLGLTPGRYEGVFAPGTNGLRKSGGIISLTLSRSGFYSGRLKPHGANYGIRGQFDGDGRTLITGPLGSNVLALVMGIYTEGLEGIGGGYSDGTFISDFVLWRQQTVTKTNPSPYAGKYTFRLSPPLATNNALTDGSGFGTVIVDARGGIKWTAALANQAKTNKTGALLDPPLFQGSATVLKGGRWSFYLPSKTGDALTGEMTFATNGTFAGDVKWFAPGFVTLTNQSATNQNVKMTGARYTPAVSGSPLHWTNGVLTIFGGGLAEPIVTPVTWQTNGSFLISSNPHNVQLFVTNATGFVGGSFTHPASNTLTRLRGAVLQSSNSAAGFFPHLPRHGGFELKRAP